MLPLLESIWAILLSWLEIPKGKFTLKITELNQKINNLTEESGPQSVIGFAYSEPEEEDYQEEVE